MRKLIAAFVCLFCITPGLAATYLRVDTDSLYTIAQQYFPDQEKLVMMLSAYNAQLVATGNQGVTATGMWDVCRAGGLDIESSTGKQQCIAFTNSLMTFADTEYYAVCDDDEYKKIPENVRTISKCERKFFNWTNVQMQQAVVLAQEYARVKWNDEIICSQNYRKKGNDDWISCKSPTTGAFYEFKFDDVRESIDVDIQRDIADAICKLHGGQPSGTWCNTDETTCNKVNASAEKFGYNAEYVTEGVPDHCIVLFNTVTDPNELRTACGINNFEFCGGQQANTSLSLIDGLKQYIAGKCGTTPATITCDAGFKTYTGKGCAVNKFAAKDDIITCYYNGQPIDLVFDDVNELSKRQANSAEQSLICINANGTFDGKNCVAADQAICEELQAQNEVSCPQCKDIYWDSTNKLCVLPDSKAATNTQNAIKIGTIAGLTVVGVVSGIFTGGTSTAAIAGYVLVTLGGAAVITSESVMTFGIFDPFVEKAQQCFINNDAKCAEDLIVNELNRMQGYKEEFTEAQQKALDEILARLVEMIPDDSVFWDDFFGNPEFFDCNEDGTDCAVKAPTQFWQVARTVGDVGMIVGGLLNVIKIVAPKASTSVATATASQTESTVYSRIQRIGINRKLGRGKNTGRVVNQGLAGDNKNILANNLKNVNVTPEMDPDLVLHVEKIVDANDFVPKNIKRNTEFLKWFEANSQYKFADPKTGKLFTQAQVDEMAKQFGQTITATATATSSAASVTLSALGLIPIGVGTGNIIYHDLEDSDTLILSKPDGNDDSDENDESESNESEDESDIIPVPVIAPVVIPDDDLVVENVPLNLGDNAPLQVDYMTPPASTQIQPTVGNGPVTTITPVQQSNVTTTATPTQQTESEPVTPYTVNKKNNTALIATAAILGAVGTGVLVGALVSGGDDDDNKPNTPEQTSQLENDINAVLSNATGTIGIVNGNTITLARMQTMVGSYTNIVNVNGNAVVVAIYNGHYFPYYMDKVTMQWLPALGISSVNGYINKYPSNPTGINEIDQISGLLNQKLSPAIVAQLTGVNAIGVQFPTPAPNAYNTINAEFPDGVARAINGSVSSTDRQLYNANYQRIQNLL